MWILHIQLWRMCYFDYFSWVYYAFHLLFIFVEMNSSEARDIVSHVIKTLPPAAVLFTGGYLRGGMEATNNELEITSNFHTRVLII